MHAMPRPADVWHKLRRGLPTLLAAVMWMAVAACSSEPLGPPAPTIIPELTDYRLGSGDRVKVVVFDSPELSGEYTISATGKIAMPLIGTLDADGRSPGELQSMVAQQLRGRFVANPSVSVEVIAYRPFFVLGEVYKPGSYPYVADMKVITAVAIAGGMTPRGNERRILIVRSTGPQQQRLSASMESAVLPGDVIKVEERFF
jgi:polysaccharide export outer membrane protein